MRKLMLGSMSFRWLWAVAVLALLVSTTAVLTVGPASAGGHTILVVDDDGMAEVGKCNKRTPADHDNIQDAIDASTANPLSVVFVCPGTYKEHVLLNKTGLTLQGITMGNRRAVVDGEDANTGPVINITRDNITLDNFIIKNSGGAADNPGIAVESDGNTITNNTVSNTRCGINLWEGGGWGADGANDNYVAHNTFMNNSADGIRLQDSSGLTGFNTVYHNSTHHNPTGDGIEIRTLAANNVITGNDAHHNRDDGIRINDDAGDDNVLTDNNAHQNDIGIEDETDAADNDVSEAANNAHSNTTDDCVGCDP